MGVCMEVVFTHDGAFKGFRYPEPEPPLQGPPRPVYDSLERVIGPYRVCVSDDGTASVYDNQDVNGVDPYGITIPADFNDLLDALDAIDDMRAGPFPVIAWVDLNTGWRRAP